MEWKDAIEVANLVYQIETIENDLILEYQKAYEKFSETSIYEEFEEIHDGVMSYIQNYLQKLKDKIAKY